MAGKIARGLGELLVTLGCILLLFAVYEVWVTDLISDRRQASLSEDLRDDWPTVASVDPAAAGPVPVAPATPPVTGQPFAFLHIPRLGPDYARAVVEGTGYAQLEQGPGHYVGSALPGRPGNFAVAGHRVGRGSPFQHIDDLRPGDPIVVETGDGWYTYRVLGYPTPGPSGIPGQQIVAPEDLSVIAPTPNGPLGGPATGAYLTLTTCHPEYSAQQRLIVHAVLDGAPLSKAVAPTGPAALTES